MEISYTKTAVKFLKSTDMKTKRRIISGIDGLMKEPPEGDIKQMRGYKDSTCRLRIGKYRIIYRYIQDTLYIEDINSRGDIYK